LRRWRLWFLALSNPPPNVVYLEKLHKHVPHLFWFHTQNRYSIPQNFFYCVGSPIDKKRVFKLEAHFRIRFHEPLVTPKCFICQLAKSFEPYVFFPAWYLPRCVWEGWNNTAFIRGTPFGDWKEKKCVTKAPSILTLLARSDKGNAESVFNFLPKQLLEK